MDKKTIFKVVGITIIVIIIISCVELLIRKLADMREKNDNYISPSQVSETQKQTEEKFIKKVNDIAELLKAKDYEKIYERFPSSYRNAKYPTYEEFEKYMNSIIKDDTKIEITDWVKYAYGYYATITLDDGKLEIPVVLWGIDENSQITLDNVISIFNRTLMILAKDTTLDLKYYIKYLDKAGYVFEVKNESNREQKFSVGNAFLYGTTRINQNKYPIVEKIEVTIPAKGSKQIEIQFPVPSGENFPPTKMYLPFTVNGTFYEKEVDVSFEDEYYSRWRMEVF